MFKKIFFGLALVSAFTACTEDYTDWGAPQANEPEAPVEASFAVEEVAPIDLAQLTGESVQIFVPTLTVSDEYTVVYELTAKNEAGDATVALAPDVNGFVTVADLQGAVEALYGKAPEARTLVSSVDAFVKINGQAIKKGTSEPFKIIATLVAPDIEEAYYVVGDGLGWDYAGAMANQFTHSGGNVYDNPIFTITVPAPYDAETGARKDFYFKIVPASAVASGDLDWAPVLGSDVADGDDRKVAGMAVGGGAFLQYADDAAQKYMITLDMMAYTMTIEPVMYSSYIYMPGTLQNWNPATAPALYSANTDGVYIGYAWLEGEFKFTKGHSWADGEYNYGSFQTYGEGFAEGDGGNINFTGTPGFYRIEANVTNEASSLNAVATSWGIIGPAQAGGWDTDTDMTFNRAEDCWEATLDLNADELKFRANDGWDINFGGDADNLTEGGNNIKVEEAGNYTVKLYISGSNGNDQRYFTLTKN